MPVCTLTSWLREPKTERDQRPGRWGLRGPDLAGRWRPTAGPSLPRLGPRTPASSASATVSVGSGRRLLGCVWGTQLSPLCSLARLQSWMACLEMTLPWLTEPAGEILLRPGTGVGAAGLRAGPGRVPPLVLGSCSFLWLVFGPGMVPAARSPPARLQPSRSSAEPSGPPEREPASCLWPCL